jgi:hypothetical protein
VVGTNGANKTKESYKSFDYFSGIYSLISPAVHVLLPLENSDLQGDPGTIKEVDHIGVGMEPSTLRDNLFCYFSEDESQFLLKTSGQGGVFENETQYTNNGGWNNSQGICAYSYDSPLVKNSIAKNIRLKEISAPDQSNIFVEKINDAYVFKNTTCSILTQPQYFQINGTGRQRSIVRSFGFLADETNELHQFKSLVLGYQKSEENNPPDEKKIIPFVDCLFGTSSGELKPSTGIYQKLIDQNLVDFTGWLPNSGDYIKLDGNNNLTLSFKLIWSSPCSDAIDCS